MHKSRLAGFIIDCNTEDLPGATAFWSAALGLDQLNKEGDYIRLDGSSRDLAIEVQSVKHPSRVHLDIEADDVEAEVKRLEALGAKRVQQVNTWWVLEAPTGQRFCVIRAKTDLAGARTWNSP
jgi:Glyoxalase-like domain